MWNDFKRQLSNAKILLLVTKVLAKTTSWKRRALANDKNEIMVGEGNLLFIYNGNSLAPKDGKTGNDLRLLLNSNKFAGTR